MIVQFECIDLQYICYRKIITNLNFKAMKKDFEKRSELIDLEEINQLEKEDVNGGAIYFHERFDLNESLIICCHSIPPENISSKDVVL